MEKGVPIRSVSRTITALMAINRHGALNMMEIARATGIPYPTACRVVQTLLYEGLIEQEPTRKYYRPTAMVQALSYGFQQNGHLVSTARPAIIALTERIGWPVSIATRVGSKMMLRDSTHANTSLTFERYHPGFTLPIFESASGKLSMAFAEAGEREAILRQLRDAGEIDEKCYRSADARLDVERVRSQGFALQRRNDFNLNPGKTASIAVPIFQDGQFEAAMTMVFFVAAMRIDVAVTEFIEDLKAVAETISVNLSQNGAQCRQPKRPNRSPFPEPLETSHPPLQPPSNAGKAAAGHKRSDRTAAWPSL